MLAMERIVLLLEQNLTIRRNYAARAD